MNSRSLQIGGTRPLTGVGKTAPFSLPVDHLMTHGVVLGMTGSGKSGLAMVLVEETLQCQVPVLMIDVKGDLPNLLLAFPSFAAREFALSSGSVWHFLGFGTSLNYHAGKSVALGGPDYATNHNVGGAFIGLSSGTFGRTAPMLPTPTGADQYWGTVVRIADYDGDGFADLAASDPRSTSGNVGVNVWDGSATGPVGTGHSLTFDFSDEFGAAFAGLMLPADSSDRSRAIRTTRGSIRRPRSTPRV